MGISSEMRPSPLPPALPMRCCRARGPVDFVKRGCAPGSGGATAHVAGERAPLHGCGRITLMLVQANGWICGKLLQNSRKPLKIKSERRNEAIGQRRVRVVVAER